MLRRWASRLWKGAAAPKDPELSSLVTPGGTPVSPLGLRRLISACRDIGHGTPCPAEVLGMLDHEIGQRRSATGTRQGPPDPATTGLAVIRDGLPDWWREQNNLLLAGPDSEPNVPLQPSHFLPPASDSVVVIGARASPGQWSLSGEGALLVVGDGAMAKATETSVRADSTVLLGDGLNALFPARVIAANGGIVVVGPGGLWAKDVALMTDDLHTIRDRATGRRVNRFAGRIVVGSRVWLGWETVVYGDSHIGDGSVVGLRSFVRNCALPSHCVSVGQPVRVVRRNIEWLLDDLG